MSEWSGDRMLRTTAPWVRLEEYPSVFKTRLPEFAERCGWVHRLRGNYWEIATREHFQSDRPLLRAIRVSDSTNASDLRRYTALANLPRQDQFVGRYWPMAQAEVDRLGKEGRREAFWQAFKLIVTAAPDAELPAALHAIYGGPPSSPLGTSMAQQLPGSSLWVLRVGDHWMSRLAAIRMLYAAQNTPDVLAGDRADFVGVKSGLGLSSVDGFGIGPYVDAAFLARAPWLLGIGAWRAGGMVATLFARPQAGRLAGAAEMVDLFATRFLTEVAPSTEKQPRLRGGDTERLFVWWIQAVDGLLSSLTDPSSHWSPAGFYSAKSHYGQVLSMDRFVACVEELLIGSRREEFVRLSLAFQALDLVEGMGLGGFDSLLSAQFLRSELRRLEGRFPSEISRLLFPRCNNAVAALADMRRGFHRTAAIRTRGIRVPRKKTAGTELLSRDLAVARYLRVVRNGHHSFRQTFEESADPQPSALFAAHGGSVKPEIADVPFIHLLRLLDNPTLLVSRAMRQRALAGRTASDRAAQLVR